MPSYFGILVGVVSFLVSFQIYSLPYPEYLEFYAYDPPNAPKLEGPLEPNDRITNCEIFGEEKVWGPESIAVSKEGKLYVGTFDGKIVNPDGVLVTKTGGRPLGLEFDAKGNLIIADAVRGLLELNISSKEIRLLSTENHVTVNDLVVSKSGKIYFTDATSIPARLTEMSTFNTERAATIQVVSAHPTGGFFSYDPVTRSTNKLMDGLVYPNGVAISEKEDYILVVETGKYRVHRYWLEGPKAGTWDIFVENLPGIPDGVDNGSNGKFWVSLFAPRNRLLDFAHPYPLLKKIVFSLPSSLRPAPKKYGFVVSIDEKGNYVESLQDPTGKVSPTSSVLEHEGILYIGTLSTKFMVRCNLKK